MSAFAVAHTPLQLLVITYSGNSVSFFVIGDGMFVNTLNFSWVWAHTLSQNYLTKKRVPVHLNRHLSL